MGLPRPVPAAAGADPVASVHDALGAECPAGRAEELRTALCGALEETGREVLAPGPVQAGSTQVGTSWADLR